MPDLSAWLDSQPLANWSDDVTPAYPVAALQTDLLLALPDTATVYRTTGTPRARTAVYAALPCAVALDTAKATGAGVLDELNPGVSSFILTYPATVTLMKDDQVEHGGNTYEVDDLMDDGSPLSYKQARMAKVGA